MGIQVTVLKCGDSTTSPDNDTQVPSPASPKVGTIDVPTSALNHNIQLTKFTFILHLIPRTQPVIPATPD